MKFDSAILEYIEGKKFSNSLLVPYDYKQPIPSRVNFLTTLAKDKSILHLGCLDHLPLIDDKIARGQWLHKTLTESAKVCLGIDINEETKKYVETKYGFKNIVLGDFTKQRLESIASQRWDYAILGEILEHIDNPVAYLEAIRTLYKGSIDRIVITVPNAFTQTSFRMANKSSELINSDHRYWFTPYTLAKVMFHAGLKFENMFFTNRVALSLPELALTKILAMIGQKPKYNFTYASSIVGVASLR
jgi:hypothetical protein